MNTLKRKREERIAKAANKEIEETTIETATAEVDAISEPVVETPVVAVAPIVKKTKKKKSSS